MMNYGAKTPKRQYLYSNATAARKIDAGKLKRNPKQQKIQTVKQYVTASGKRGYCGTDKLKATEHLACFLNLTLEAHKPKSPSPRPLLKVPNPPCAVTPPN